MGPRALRMHTSHRTARTSSSSLGASSTTSPWIPGFPGRSWKRRRLGLTGGTAGRASGSGGRRTGQRRHLTGFATSSGTATRRPVPPASRAITRASRGSPEQRGIRRMDATHRGWKAGPRTISTKASSSLRTPGPRSCSPMPQRALRCSECDRRTRARVRAGSGWRPAKGASSGRTTGPSSCVSHPPRRLFRSCTVDIRTIGTAPGTPVLSRRPPAMAASSGTGGASMTHSKNGGSYRRLSPGTGRTGGATHIVNAGSRSSMSQAWAW